MVPILLLLTLSGVDQLHADLLSENITVGGYEYTLIAVVAGNGLAHTRTSSTWLKVAGPSVRKVIKNTLIEVIGV